MAQSYGNSSNSNLTAAVDNVQSIQTISQPLGTSYSQRAPALGLTTALTLSIKLNVETVAQTVTLAVNDTAYDIAADIQAKVRALSPLGFAPANSFTNFICRYDSAQDKYLLIDGEADSAPATAAVTITGGTAAPLLQLGLANQGTEAATSTEVISYTVNYQLVFGAGSSFGSFPVVVTSAEIATPTDLSQVMAVANARAAQIKKELTLSAYIDGDNSSQNGPVILPS